MKSFLKYKKSFILPSILINMSKNFKLYKPQLNKGGRNNSGKICVHHQGGGHKQNYRVLDYKNIVSESRLLSIEYDPNRSAFIGLFLNIIKNNLYFDIICEEQIIGDIYKLSLLPEDVSIGNKMYLKDLPLGTVINSLESCKGKGSQYLRSAGSFGKLQQKDLKSGLARIKMPSKKNIYVSLNCICKIGVVSNSFLKNRQISKAGRNRWLNCRPTVRGVAMNPVDHPHGGGEGKTSGGRHPVTPWGRLTKGKKTRSLRKKGYIKI